ncbi:hypothetical protein ACFQRB_05430 [Halobaculum litoreum]|uniref:Histidine kinase-like ATPase domain-containing protein n=1 Tax=Halobaculum litoreum TaxID=3031998 RepID=A0ABD5XSQ5_9EURY
MTATAAVEAGDATVLAEVGSAVAELIENAVVHSRDPEPGVRVVVDADDDGITVSVEGATRPSRPWRRTCSGASTRWTTWSTARGSGCGSSTGRSTPPAAPSPSSRPRRGNRVRIHLPRSPPATSHPSRPSVGDRE